MITRLLDRWRSSRKRFGTRLHPAVMSIQAESAELATSVESVETRLVSATNRAPARTAGRRSEAASSATAGTPRDWRRAAATWLA